jgi:hypothetical protein
MLVGQKYTVKNYSIISGKTSNVVGNIDFAVALCYSMTHRNNLNTTF